MFNCISQTEYMTPPRPLLSLARRIGTMVSRDSSVVYFGAFDVTPQVFHSTSLSFAVVNLKPLVPGHVLVSPRRVVGRLTDLSSQEVTDLFITVQKVQRMLALIYFSTSHTPQTGNLHDGSFNIAIQDGPDAGQSVPHCHCHIIPRLKGNETGDGIYDQMASEEGNIGGALWDREQRPKGGGHFAKLEDAARKARTINEMAIEADLFREKMRAMEE